MSGSKMPVIPSCQWDMTQHLASVWELLNYSLVGGLSSTMFTNTVESVGNQNSV